MIGTAVTMKQTNQHSHSHDLIVQNILNACDAKKIVLFGSYAKGKQHEKSDLDLIVVLSDTALDETNRFAQEVKILRSFGAMPIPIDILIYTEAEYSYYGQRSDHIVRRATDEGIVLYAA